MCVEMALDFIRVAYMADRMGLDNLLEGLVPGKTGSSLSKHYLLAALHFI